MRVLLVRVLLLLTVASGSSACQAGGPSGATITVDTLVRYQTMTGWEAVAQAGQGAAGYPGWADSLFELAAHDLGLNRLRLEIRSGLENLVDYFSEADPDGGATRRCERYQTVNDNADPARIDWSGFHFGELDHTVEKVVLPMRQRLAARGERLSVTLTYVAFLGQCRRPLPYVHQDPAEYAELMLAVFLHLREKFGLTPDGLEVILEPDNTSHWDGHLIGRAIAATGPRLAAAGFRPVFIAPSTTSMANAVKFFDALIQVPGVRPYLGELSYHRYRGVTRANLTGLAERGRRYGLRTAMLEHIGSGVDDLYDDLTIGQVSAWQQYGLAHPSGRDRGGLYYPIIGGRPMPGSRTRWLRQYFRYVRLGAQRVGASSDRRGVRAVAFQNPDGRLAVVVHLDRAAELVFRQLRPGTYGASLATKVAGGMEQGSHTVGGDGILRVRVPAPGVLTVYGGLSESRMAR